MIRPTPEIFWKKQMVCDQISSIWLHFRDYILATHFDYPIRVNELSRAYISADIVKEEWAFVPCSFPYNIPNDSHHYVLWNSKVCCEHSFEDDEINEQIRKGITNLGYAGFDFAWYVNPKPSIPELWHCQVFWTSSG